MMAADIGYSPTYETEQATYDSSSAAYYSAMYDVNQDGFTSPDDALMIANDLQGDSNAWIPISAESASPYSPDVNGDGVESAADFYAVVNYLAPTTNPVSSNSSPINQIAPPAGQSGPIGPPNSPGATLSNSAMASLTCSPSSSSSDPGVYLNHYDTVVDMTGSGGQFTFPEGTLVNTGHGWVFNSNDPTLHGTIAFTGHTGHGDSNGNTPISFTFGPPVTCGLAGAPCAASATNSFQGTNSAEGEGLQQLPQAGNLQAATNVRATSFAFPQDPRAIASNSSRKWAFASAASL